MVLWYNITVIKGIVNGVVSLGSGTNELRKRGMTSDLRLQVLTTVKFQKFNIWGCKGFDRVLDVQ